MTKPDNRSRVERIVIAVTAVSPLQRFWQEALHIVAESRAELHALFLEDARWHRAATLPFTREISRLSGTDADFTAERAAELQNQAVERVQRELQNLAAEQRHELVFEVLPEADRQRIMDLASGTRCVIIAPEAVARQPEFKQVRKIGCRVIVIRD